MSISLLFTILLKVFYSLSLGVDFFPSEYSQCNNWIE